MCFLFLADYCCVSLFVVSFVESTVTVFVVVVAVVVEMWRKVAWYLYVSQEIDDSHIFF